MQQLSDNEFLFTSESVTEGHPDKVCDQISDGVLDAVMKDDPTGRVACETLVNTGLVVVSGEITTETYVDIPAIARETIRGIGYDDPRYGFDHKACAVLSAIDEQSPDIAQGVDVGLEQREGDSADELDSAGAGDQGMMFGYASGETKALMPMPIQLAHQLARQLAEVRKAGVIPYLGPDGKTQVTIRYENDRPVEVAKVLISTQHREEAGEQMIATTSGSTCSSRCSTPSTRSSSRRRSCSRTSWSTRPASSSSAARSATPASPAARSSSTPTAARPATAAAPSRARTPRRSTARLPTRPATSRRTSSPPGSPTAARSRSRTRSAWRTRSR